MKIWIKSLHHKLRLVVYFQLLAIAGLAIYGFLWWPHSSPDLVYRRAMTTIGGGLEQFTSPELIDDITGSGYRGQLTISGFDRQQAEELLEELDLRRPDDPPGSACFGQLAETDNQVRFEAEASFDDPVGQQLLGSAQVEADWQINQSAIGGFELRLVADDGDQGLIPPIYLMVDKTACLEQLVGPEAGQFLGSWWLIDSEKILENSLGIGLADLLEVARTTEDQAAGDQVDREDYQELAEIVVDLLQEYVFSHDPEKMIIKLDQQVDQQAEFDGQGGLYKYQGQLDGDNTVEFLRQAAARIGASEAYQKLETPDGPEAPESLELTEEEVDDIRQAVDEFNQENRIEIWINPKNRLLRNLRIINVDPTSSALGST